MKLLDVLLLELAIAEERHAEPDTDWHEEQKEYVRKINECLNGQEVAACDDAKQ